MRDGVQRATWSPDGARLLFAAAVAVERRPDDVSEAQWQDRPRVVTRADYKSDGIGYKLDERTHLYTPGASSSGRSGGPGEVARGRSGLMDLGCRPDLS
jgi:hypothetical protein